MVKRIKRLGKGIESLKEQIEEQKKDEEEKAVEQQNIKQAETAAKAEKHITPVSSPKIQRMALKK
jgi:hypothetical protein